MEKPTKLETYDETRDPYEHLTMQDYHKSIRVVKGKVFVLTLKGTSMKWFKGLKDNSIRYWITLCDDFTSHFTT